MKRVGSSKIVVFSLIAASLALLPSVASAQPRYRYQCIFKETYASGVVSTWVMNIPWKTGLNAELDEYRTLSGSRLDVAPADRLIVGGAASDGSDPNYLHFQLFKLLSHPGERPAVLLVGDLKINSANPSDGLLTMKNGLIPTPMDCSGKDESLQSTAVNDQVSKSHRTAELTGSVQAQRGAGQAL